MFPHEISLDVCRRLHAERDAAGPQIAPIDGLTGGFVECISITLCPFACDTQVEPVIDDRDIDHAFEAAVLIIADIGGGERLKLIRRLRGNEIDDACGRIPSIKRSLRSAQHFDLPHIIEFLFEEVIADERDIV